METEKVESLKERRHPEDDDAVDERPELRDVQLQRLHLCAQVSDDGVRTRCAHCVDPVEAELASYTAQWLYTLKATR